MTAIAATFSDFRPVKSRGVYQIILEVPAEKANDVIKALGGVPVFGSEQWVGVAPLNTKPDDPCPPSSTGPEQGASIPQVASSNLAADTTTPSKERRPFHTLPRSQQAALACQDERFRAWLWPFIGRHHSSGREGWEADRVRQQCGVTSRREFDGDPAAASAWDALYDRYLTETGQQAARVG